MSGKRTLTELFQRIIKVNYCVISSHRSLPLETNGPINILTDNKSAIVDLLELTLVKDNIYGVELSNGKKILIAVFEKGKRTFPEMFESLILGRAVLRHGVKAPETETYPFVRLYWKLFYEGFLLGDDDREMLKEMVQRKTGAPITPKYKFLKITK
jgi:hypothetical protein